MVLSVQFNYQSFFCAVEIDNEVKNAVLSPELPPCKFLLLQVSPQVSLCRSSVVAELFAVGLEGFFVVDSAFHFDFVIK